jgi:hypothetical protein
MAATASREHDADEGDNPACHPRPHHLHPVHQRDFWRGRWVRVRSADAVDKLFTGIACHRAKALDPTDRFGLDGITAEDTGEADSGRLLDALATQQEKAEKGLCAREDSNLWPTASETVALSS